MNEYLTESELSERLQLSRTMLYQLRREGMPCLRVNRMIRYCPKDVENWLSERAHGSADVAGRKLKGD